MHTNNRNNFNINTIYDHAIKQLRTNQCSKVYHVYSIYALSLVVFLNLPNDLLSEKCRESSQCDEEKKEEREK